MTIILADFPAIPAVVSTFKVEILCPTDKSLLPAAQVFIVK